MIERLDKDCGKLQKKINELVDTVNILQAQVAILEEHAHPTAKTEPTDPYAEQSKWIGSLCKFWDAVDYDEYWYDILTEIDENQTCPYVSKLNGVYYTYCEPVKPDDDIIYKGE